MFIDEIRRAVEVAPRSDLARIGEAMWKAWGAGMIGDDEAQGLSDLIAARKAIPAPAKPVQARVGSRPRSSAHLERRRRWAACGLLPPQIATKLTLGEAAVMAVIGTEVRKRGDCRLTIGELADVAGVSASTVKNALRAGRALGIISITERRLTAFRNASNIVRLTSREWTAWLRLGGGGKSVPRSPTRIDNQAASQQQKPGRAAGEKATAQSEPSRRRRGGQNHG